MGIVELIYPKLCLGCKREGKYVCKNCRKMVEANGGSLRYTGVVQRIMKEIKYRGAYDMIVELVEIWEEMVGRKINDKEWLVTSVPMWEQKKILRGFNQAELMAKEIARKWRFKYEELLRRKRETRPQFGLDREERVINVCGAFELSGKNIESRSILLVDDVMTTGITLDECIKTLKEGGAKEIKKIALAR